MAKTQSRTSRWQEAVAKAVEARDKVVEAADELSTALGDLRDVQAEYEEWRDSLPEGINQSAVADKLNAIVDDISLDSADDPLEDWQSISEAIDNAEGADLPLGFGRD